MKEYIDKETAKSIFDAKSDMATGTPKVCFAAAAKMIDKLPAADVVEVVHGEWKETECPYGDMIYTCSVCGEDWVTIDGTPAENFMNYCPRCGAKMDGGIYGENQ